MDCGFAARTRKSQTASSLSAEVTHNHLEGIKGTLAVADAIFLCRYYFGGYYGDYEKPINDDLEECKWRIKEYIEREYGYDLFINLDEIRPMYRFNEICQDTVSQASIAFLGSIDFEVPSATPSPSAATAITWHPSTAVSSHQP